MCDEPLKIDHTHRASAIFESQCSRRFTNGRNFWWSIFRNFQTQFYHMYSMIWTLNFIRKWGAYLQLYKFRICNHKICQISGVLFQFKIFHNHTCTAETNKTHVYLLQGIKLEWARRRTALHSLASFCSNLQMRAGAGGPRAERGMRPREASRWR